MTIAEFTDEAIASKPAITCNTCGQGKVYYLGVLLPDAELKDLMGEILPDFPIKNNPEGVEITLRKNAEKRVVFIINHAPERRTVTLPGPFLELLSGQTVGPELTIARHGVLVLKA